MTAPETPVTSTKTKRLFLRMWLGSWADRPKGDRQKRGLKLAKEEVIVTGSGAIISPVAVAVIDVLGMSDLLEVATLQNIAENVAGPFFDLDGEAYRFGNMGLPAGQLRRLGFRRVGGKVAAMFADTIVVAQRPTWECADSLLAAADAIVQLASYVCKITAVNALQQIWLRSAIAYGDCLLSVSNTPIYLGSAVREAFYWEKRQEWSGGMLSPSAVAVLRSADTAVRSREGPDFSPKYPRWLVKYDVPLKPDKRFVAPKPSIALNWRAFEAIGAHAFLKQGKPNLSGSSAVVRKIRNTIRFHKHVAGAAFDRQPHHDLGFDE